MAKAHPLKFIAFVLGLLVLFILSSTDMFATWVAGQGQSGAVEYIHVDTATAAPADGKIEITVVLTDQQGKLVTGRTYGVDQGQFSIPTNGLTATNGDPCFFSVDTAKVKEIKDSAGQGTGVYTVPVQVEDWVGGAGAPVYTLKVVYKGGGADTGDDASGEAYKLTATTTLNAGSEPDSAVLKFAPAQINKLSLNVPEWKQGQPEPAAVVKTVVFRVKLIGQARDAVTGSRMFKGRAATPEEVAKWLPPVVFDSAGRTIKAEYGRIKEEQVPYFGFRRGEWRGTGVYEIEVKLTCPADLAGKKGAITIGRAESDVSLVTGATVNFQSSGEEEAAEPNPYFANPYFYNPPNTPTVTEIGFAGVISGGATVEFPAGTTQFPTNGDYIISETGDRTAVTNLRLRATIDDPDGYNISQAEFFKQATMPTGLQNGTGTAMLAEPPGFSSDPILPSPPPALSSTLIVYYNIPSATVKSYDQAQYDFWVHGKSALGNWGSGPANYGNTLLSVDMTKPTAAVTKPVTDEYVRGAYRIEGDAGKGTNPSYESDINVVQVYDEVTGDFTDLAENDSGRGGTNFSKWYYLWDSMTADDGHYVFRSRTVDLAGNIGDEAQVAVIADNVKTIANVTVPLEGHGWDNTVSTGWGLTGIVYDPNMPPVGTLVKGGSSDADATDRTNIGGTWSGNNLTADRMLTGQVTLQGALSMVANSILAWGTTVNTGTTAANASDRTAIGGIWSGNTLTAPVTILNNTTIHGTVVVAAGSVLTLPATVLGSNSFSKYTFEWGTGRKGAGDTTGWNIPIGGTWTGAGPYTLSADRTTVVDAVQGTLTTAAGSTLKAGTFLKAGTVCSSATDRDAIGGTWTGTGPYTLGSDRTLAADVTLSGTLTAAAGSTYKIGSTFKAGTTCTDVNDTRGAWSFSSGHAGGANQLNPAGAMGTLDTTGLPTGDYSVRITGTDKAGNINLDRTGYPIDQEVDHMNRFYVHIDTVAPTTVITPATGGWFQQRIFGTAADDISGVDKVEVIIERNDTTPHQYWTGAAWVNALPASWPTATIDTGRGLPSATWYYDGPDNTNLPRGTSITIHARATDDVKNIPVTTGHLGAEVTSGGTWDSDKPTTSVPGSPNGTNGWYMAPAPSFTISAADVVPGSGMNGGAVWYVWTTQAVAAAPAGGWTQLAYAASPVSIKAPTGAPDVNGVYALSTGSTMPDGKYRLWYRGRDLAGNVEANHYSDFKIDATPPPVPTIYAEQSYWYGSDLGEAAFTEGTANTEYGTVVTDANLDNGACTYFYQRATDAGFTAGLADSVTWQSLTTYVGWPIYNNAFYYQFTGLSDAQIYYYRVKAKDYAGNESTYSGAQSSTQDNIGPTLNQNNGTVAPLTWYNTNKTVQIWTTDTTGGSGPKGFRWAWDASPGNDWLNMSVAGGATGSTTFPGVGKRTLHVIGYDNIYTATASNSFTYDHLNNYEPKHRTAETDYEFWYDPYAPYNWQGFSYAAVYDGWSQTKSPTCTITIQDDIAVPSAVSGLRGSTAKFAYSSDGGATWSAWLNTTWTGVDGSTGVETLTTTAFTFAGDSATQNKVKFQIADMAGSVVESSGYTVKVDSTPPTVVSTVPQDDPDPNTPAPLVAPETPMRATFSDDMLAATVNSVTNFTLESANPVPGGAKDDGTWSSVSLLSASYNAGTKTVDIIPTTTLVPTKKYRLTVTVNIKDKAGNSLAVPYKWYWYVSDISASIDWPYPGNTVYGTIPIHGAATGTNAKYYKLQYGAGGTPATWLDIAGATGTTQKSSILSQTDWSSGASGGGAPEVVTTLTGYKKFWQSTGIDATSDLGAIRLAKATATGGWYNKDWLARKRILVTNPNPGALYNYQVKLTVNWTNDMKTDFSDLRFTDYDKTSLIDYWVESYTIGVSATVWVEVPNVAPAAAKAVYMYYGNPAAATTSNAANTFLNNQIFLRTFYNNVSSGSPPYYFIQSHADFDTYVNLMGETGYGLYGSGYVDRVDHTVNPYGGSDYYTSQYKFLFIPTVGGNYKFGTNSDAASEAIKNTADTDTTHTALVGWYGNHGVGTQFDDHSAYYTLAANVPVWLEYRQNNSDNTGRQAQMGVMVPGQAWKTVNTTNFAGQIFARNYATVEPTVSITDESVYEPTGSVTSSVIDGGGSVTWGAVAWTETIASGTDVTVQVKTSADNVTWTDWSYPRSVAGGDVVPPGIATARYIQYKINLKGNATATRTPVLSDITLYHTPLGTWNTTSVADGVYTIRLLTTIADPADWTPDNVLEARVTVTVNNTTEPNSTIDVPPIVPVVTTNVFDYTGADQTYTVPAGVYSINVKEWGAGGGGGNAGGWNYGFAGGGGGYTTGDIAVTPGQVLTVMVGGGGVNGTIAHSLTYSYGGGGPGQITSSDARYGAQGGGRSAIRSGATDLLTAGGGGGGGASRATNGQQGGAGGGGSGLNGSSYTPTAAGGGGTQSAGGAGGIGSYNGTAGSQYTGGTSGINSYGGGGGGGWYGGGGGAYLEPNDMGGGGGGSGYINGAGVSGASTTAGSGAVQANSSDPQNLGSGAGGAAATSGRSGRVIITSTYIPVNTIYYKANNAVTGTATDVFPGIGAVDVRIRRGSDNNYWTGAGWSVTETWVRADSTGGHLSTWTFNQTTPQNIFASGITYTISSRATDLAGMAETTPDTITVYGDNVAPNVTLDFPKAPNNYLSADYVGITGTATDTNFKDYKVEYQKNGSAVWTQIGATQTSVGNGFYQTTNLDFKPDPAQSDTAAGFNGTRAIDGKVMLGRRGSTAQYPNQASLETNFVAAGFNSSGSGVVATDGSYVYVKRYGGYAGPASFNKVGTGYGGTTAGTNYGQLTAGIYADSVSAFYLDGYVYNGYTTDGNTLERQNVTTGAIEYVQMGGNTIPLPRGRPGTFDYVNAGLPTVIKDGTTYKMWYSGHDGANWRIGYAESTDGVTWTKNPNPVLDLGGFGSWDDNAVYYPTVVKDGATYKMWYSGDDHANSRTGYATSTDGINWTKYAGNPVMNLGAPADFDSAHLLGPCVLQEGPTDYKMWYSGSNGVNWRIGYATSTDGITWTKNAGNPVVPLGIGWESTHTSAPSVIKDGTTYKMWYNGFNGTNWRIGYAESTNATAWTKSGSNPVVNLGAANTFDTTHAVRPSAIKDGTTYKMWYTGHDGLRWAGVGYATSADGVAWTKNPTAPVVGDRLLKRNGATDLTMANTNAERADVMVTTDGRYVYTIGANGTTDWKVRIFDSQNNFIKVGEFTTVMGGFTAYNTYGFIADGFYIYPIEAYYYYVGAPYYWGNGTWPGDNSRVTRIGTGLNGTTSGEIVNQWYEGAWDEFEVNGQYDPLNRKIWMGKLQGGTNIYRFNAGDESATSGTYTSRVFDMGPGATTGTINWTATTPGGTTLTVETRVSSARTFSTEDSTITSNWQTATNGGAIPTPTPAVPNARYIQYRLTMTGPGGATSPSLDDITLRYTPTNSVLETWRVVDMTEGQYRIRVTGSDRAGNEVVATADPVYIDKTPPTASLNTLLNLDGNNTGYVTGATVALGGTADDTNGWAPDANIANWTVEHKRTGAAVWTLIATNSTKVPPASFGAWNTTIAVPEGTEDNTSYAVRLRVTDKAGLTTYTTPQSVFIDNSNPVVSSTVPVSGATNVDCSQNITAYFDDLMYAPSVTAANFLLDGGAVTPAGVIYTDQILTSYATFVLAGPLTKNIHNASLATGIHNKAGRSIAAINWSFTTSNVDAAIYLPMANAHVAGAYPVMGRAAASTNGLFSQYKLEWAAGRQDAAGAGPWTQIGNTGTETVLSQSNVQTTWNNAVNPNTNPVSFSTTSDQYYARDANVITTNPGYVQLGSSNIKWLSGAWSSRKPVTVNNTGSTAVLTDYQIQVPVTFAAGMKTDFSDLRFTDTDGQTLLNYWIEKYTASTSATVWVKVSSVAASSNKIIYMYYGNAGAPNAQNPAGTFDFFDGFDTGSTIDASRWNTTAALGFLQAGARSQLKATTTGGRLTSNATFSYPVVLEAREMSSYLPPNGISALGFYGSSSNAFGILHYPGATHYRNDGNWVNIGNLMVEDTWYRLTVEPRTQFRARYKIMNDTTGTVQRDETVTNAVSGERIALGTRYDDVYSEPTSTSWDWVLARKYAATEPAVSLGVVDSYQNSGVMTSVVFDGATAQNWRLISWTENVPKGSNITVETRTGNVPAPDGTWTLWSAPSSYSGGTVIPVGQQGKRYIQYRVSFYGNGATLLDITVWHTSLMNWDTIGLTDGPYTLRLTITDTASDWTDAHVLKKAVSVNVDNTKPVVVITDPPDNSQLATNMKTVTGTASDANASVRKVELKVNSGVWNTAIGTSRVNEDVASAVYSGAWTTYTGPEPSDGTLRETSVPSTSVTYTFTGTAVNLIAKRGPDQGYASVQVDAQAPITVDLYAPIALFQQTVFSQTGLSTPGTHTLTVTSTGTSNPAANNIYINVDAFETGGSISWTYDWVTNSVPDGSNTISARATDGAGNLSDEAARTVTVDNTDPVSLITNPLANSAFTTDQPVNGTADDTNFDRYIVDFSYGAAADNWIPIATGLSSVSAGNLGTWTAPTRTPIFDWQTDGDPENWSPQQGITNISVSGGSFNGRTTGTAPYYIKTPAKLTINGNETKVLKIRMKVSDASGYAKLFWKYSYPFIATYPTVNGVNLPIGEQVPTSQEDEWGYPSGTGAGQFGESRRMIKWPVINPGQWVEYTVDMSLGKVWVDGDAQHDKAHPIMDYSQIWPTTGFWAGTVYQLRFDPSDIPNVDFNLDHISLASADGNYRIRLTTYDKVGRNKVTSQYPVMIDRNTPACIITTPVNMTFLPSGTNVSVTGTSADDLVNGVASGVSKVEYRVIQNVDNFAPTVGPWLSATGTTAWSATVTLPPGWHGLQARAFDGAGNIQESNYSYVTVDADPPPVPRIRAMADRSRGGILLSWTPVKDPGSGTDYYVLYRGSTPVTTGMQYPDGVAIESADSELVTKDFGNGPETFRAFHACNAIDTAFTPNTNVRYYIRAVDQVGNYSAKGSISGLYDTQPPTTPSVLTATRAGTTTSVQLAWNPSTDNQQVAEYRVYRVVKPGGIPGPYDFTPGDSNKIGVAMVTGTFFTTKFFDSNLAENTTYCYKVVAYDDSLIPSNASNVAEVTIGTKQTYNSTLPHKTFSANSDQCVMCHRTHTGPGKNLLKRTYEADTCYTCHDGTGSNTPTKAEFDYAPNGLHRVKDDVWPSGALSCIDCHNPHLNTEKASYENFDSIPLGSITGLTKPPTWTFGTGDWAATGNATHVELSQTNKVVNSLATFDTGINIAATGGYFSTIVRFDEAGGQAYYSIAANGLTAGNGITFILDSDTNTYKLMLNGSVVSERTQSVTITPGTVYRIKVKLDENKTLNAKLYTVAKSDLPTGHDVITDTLVGSIKHTLVTGDYKGSNVSLGTFGAKASFDQVHVNVPGMLQNRYRRFYKSGSAAEYTVPDDRVLTEAFCLSCHGSSSDDPGGSHTQYYSSIHNPLMGGMNDQSLDQENTGQVKGNPTTITPRWQDIRAEWRDLKTNPSYRLTDGRTLGELLKGTANGCLYCHGYHGQQWYDKNASGEEELCYMCHGRIANYSRDGWNVYRQYSGYVEDTSARIEYSGIWTTLSGPQYGGGSTKQFVGPRADWYNTNWGKRQSVTVNNTGGAMSGYQVKLNVGYDAAMRTDFADLRFTDSNGLTSLPYWIETFTASNRAIVWVKVDLLAASTKQIFMYFNNPGATDAGNGDNVFDFFDDFNDGTINTTTKWVEKDNASDYITESGGTLNVSGGPTNWGTIGMYSVPNLARPFIFEVSQKYTGGNYNMIGVKNTTANISYTDLNYAGYNIYDGGGNRLAVYEDGASRGDQLHTLSAVDWNYEKFTVKSTGAIYYHGDTPQNYAQYYNSTYSTNSPEKVAFANYNQAFKLDNARVRKYAATEPGTSFGATELPGGARYGFDSDYVNVYCETGAGKGTIRIFVDSVEQIPAVNLAGFPAGTNTLVFSKTGLTEGTRHIIDIMPVVGSGVIDLDAVRGSGSKHGLTMLEATIKCTSCHGQRAMTDRHVYEGYSTSVITNPNNIKQYWSDQRMQGKTINDYCNACHKEADRKGRVLIETHTSSKIVPYTIKYPAMVTTPSANGFDRTGYTLGDAYTAQENFPGVTVNDPVDWTTVVDDLYDGGAARYSATPLAWLEFTFQGSSVTFVTKKSVSYGYARILIDNVPITDGEIALSGDVGNNKSGFDLYSAADLWTQAVYTRSGLDPTLNHTIRVIVVGDKNPLSGGYRVDIDAFRFTVPRVGHYLYLAPYDPLKGKRNCASTCHDDLAPYIRDSQEASTKITCTTCHHPHASDNDRLVHQPEDYTEANGTVHKGACLHCHDGSVTK
ncbi:MAG: DUF2341 domain-containing protein [Actinomycetota bacterium]